MEFISVLTLTNTWAFLLWMSLLKCLVDDREKWKAGQTRSRAGGKAEVAPSTDSPVDDAFFVKEHECRNDLRSVETSSGFVKTTGLLNVEHQVTSIHKLHDKEQTVLEEARGS